jgi:hypothetical protein
MSIDRFLSGEAVDFESVARRHDEAAMRQERAGNRSGVERERALAHRVRADGIRTRELRREWNSWRSREGAGELGEDRQVGM